MIMCDIAVWNNHGFSDIGKCFRAQKHRFSAYDFHTRILGSCFGRLKFHFCEKSTFFASLAFPYRWVVPCVLFVARVCGVLFPEMSKPQFSGGKNQKEDEEDSRNYKGEDTLLAILSGSLFLREERHRKKQAHNQNHNERTQ
jgi:hypothetical protein